MKAPPIPWQNKSMKTKLTEFLEKKRELGLYLIFGVLTTLIGWGIYYGMMLGGRALLALPPEEDQTPRYLALYTVAQITQWCGAVLFAFYTNRRWVFTDADKSVPMYKQLGAFASSRLVTFGLDYVITYAGTVCLALLFPTLSGISLFGKERNGCELLSKLVAAVVVVVANYAISKLFVFKKKN